MVLPFIGSVSDIVHISAADDPSVSQSVFTITEPRTLIFLNSVLNVKAVVAAFNQEEALVGAFSVIVQPVVEPMDRFAALIQMLGAGCNPLNIIA